MDAGIPLAALPGAGPECVRAVITRDPIDVTDATSWLRSDADGAVCAFTGFVRDSSHGQVVNRLDYEAYEPMALKQMRSIGEDVIRNSGATAVAMIHRVGSLQVGETTMVVAASAPHRREAFVACSRLVEAVKSEVPVWKRERGPWGASWVESSGELSHVGTDGDFRMVDVSGKSESPREACAEGTVRCSPEAFSALQAGNLPKGDVFAVARVAGLAAAKRTPDLIPLCHPLAITHADVDVRADPAVPGVRVGASVRCVGRTGVEMEALTAVAAACLTVIDMVKAADPWTVIEDIGLVSKAGGRRGSMSRSDRAQP